MSARWMAAIAMAALAAAPAAAQEVQTEKQKCERLVKDLVEMRKASVAGPVSNKRAEDLIEVTAHLCAQGNFVYAQKTAAAVRGMLATE